MAKRKAAEAAAGKGSLKPKRKKQKRDTRNSIASQSNVNTGEESQMFNDFFNGTCNTPPSPFQIVLEALTAIDAHCYHYFYQVCLLPGGEMYPGIGTFSTLFHLDERKAFEVLCNSNLVLVDRNKKASFNTKQWETIKQYIPKFTWVKDKGRQKRFLFGIGSFGDGDKAGEKPACINDQIERKRELNISSNCRRQQRAFNQKWNAFMRGVQSRSPSNEDDQLSPHSSADEHAREGIVLEADGGKRNRRKHRLTNVGGKPHPMPNGYKGLHTIQFTHLHDCQKAVKNITKAGSKTQCHPTEQQRMIIGTFAARWPNISDIAIEQILSAGGIQLAFQSSLFRIKKGKSILQFDNITEALEPSRTSVNNSVIFTAAHRVIVNAERLAKSKKVFLGCDKGGGVLIKMAFFWDMDLGKIVELNLDFDKSGDKAKDGGLAIQHSMQKYTFGNRQWKISGGSSDSGGGFTGGAMKRALTDLHLVDEEEYIHINCTHHNDQTNLRVAIEKNFGAGGKDKRNVLQLVHAFSDMQKLFDKNEIHPIMEFAWEFVMGDNVVMPGDFLLLMQEPILTRWGTVGEACRYVERFRSVLVSLAHGLCGSTSNSSNLALCAGNFKSLIVEEEIGFDLAFLSDFDDAFFRREMDFNHSTDPNIGRPGFLGNHHLVRYFLKWQALQVLVKELNNGTVDRGPAGAKLTSFWKRMAEGELLSAKTNSLKKARCFVATYLISLKKHNAQFVSSDLLFLATFGEFETGNMVAKMLQCAHEKIELQFDTPPIGEGLEIFASTIHKKEINLVRFAEFLKDMCWTNAPAAVDKSNFTRLVRPTVFRIADGTNVWDGTTATKLDREIFLTNFGALPSTAEMVERAVKSAKLCQKTGKGERNVTAYGIAGDGLKEACVDQLIFSTYPERMEAERKRKQKEAEEAGRPTRSKNEYTEDFTRGPSCTRNTLDHALYLYKKVQEIRKSIGSKMYDDRLKRTKEMLTVLHEQGSAVRYSKSLATFKKAVADQHKPGPRELERGVTLTAANKNEIPFKTLRAKHNVLALIEEAFVRGLGTQHDLGLLGYQKLCKKIKEQIKSEWLFDNLGKEFDPEVLKSFLPRSTAKFVFAE
jgi:hypothetical protein